MSETPMEIVIIGLSLSSSWGNGHATTYRSLLRGLHEIGHHVRFLERDVPWYRAHRDLVEPAFCKLHFYDDLDELDLLLSALPRADAVILGSYVPEGAAVADLLIQRRPPRLCYYDIDTPVTLANLDNGSQEYLRKQQIPRFDAYYSFSGGTILDRLRQDYGARRTEPLFCSVDPLIYRPTRDALRWDLGYLGTYSEDRQSGLDRLLLEPARQLPDLRFVVAGSNYPEGIDWPSNVERLEHVAPADHASFYSRQRFTLNVTRADMVASGFAPSIRLFEAAASGTAIISDRWDGLSGLLPEGEALLCAESSQDVVNHLTHMDDRTRRRIAHEGRERILSDHTGKARARQLVSSLRDVIPCPAAASSVHPATAGPAPATAEVPARARFP